MKLDKESAINNLKTLRDILEKNRVKWWLTDGTLLGLFREGDFISHDTDTDIGIDHLTFTKQTYLDIIDAGFKFQHLFGIWGESFEITLVRGGVKTDLFFFYLDGDRYYHCAFDEFMHNGSFRYDFNYKPFDTKWCDFLGEQFRIPEDPLTFIETKYGVEEWKTPQVNWSWSKSPKNVVRTGQFVYNNLIKINFDKWLKS